MGRSRRKKKHQNSKVMERSISTCFVCGVALALSWSEGAVGSGDSCTDHMFELCF